MLPPVALTTNVRTRLRELEARAPWQAAVARPIDEAAISAFETRLGIALPAGYRDVLLEVGDRAPLPGRRGGSLLPLRRARAIAAVASLLGDPCDPLSVVLEWDEVADDWVGPSPLRGVFPIAERGGGQTWALAVSGPNPGQVWSIEPGDDPPVTPEGSFDDWYAGELERAIVQLRASDEALAELAGDPAPASRVRLALRHALADRVDEARDLLTEADADADALPDAVRPILDRARSLLALDAGEPGPLPIYAGMTASLAGDHPRAIALLRSALAGRPHDAAAAAWFLARSLSATGDWHAARRALRRGRNDARDHALIAAIELATGDPASALAHVDAAERDLDGEWPRVPDPPSLVLRVRGQPTREQLAELRARAGSPDGS